MFGTAGADLRRLGTVRREVHVALLDPRSDAQFLYPATILHSGLLSASDAAAGGISFSPRRCVYRKGRQFVALQPSDPIDPAVLNTAEYFVTVRFGGLNPALVADYPPPRAAMLEEVSDEVSPLLRRRDADARALLFGGRESGSGSRPCRLRSASAWRGGLTGPDGASAGEHAGVGEEGVMPHSQDLSDAPSGLPGRARGPGIGAASRY